VTRAEGEVRIMDERQRLLERAFSREGALEPVEEFIDPGTAQVVRMTRSQWALAEYDRSHGSLGADVDAEMASGQPTDDIREFPEYATAGAEHETQPPGASSRPKRGARRFRRAAPYLAAICGLALGIGGTLAVQGALAPAPPVSTDAGSSVAEGAAGLSAGAGQGDEGATLAAVSNYFATAPHAEGLPLQVTQGFDVTSFRRVAGTMNEDTTAIYAARRFDGAYCLVAVAKAGSAAETCGTMDDIARRGLTLTENTIDDTYGEPAMVTVTWQTDGTLSWAALPPLG
jgi:hypothetical protein